MSEKLAAKERLAARSALPAPRPLNPVAEMVKLVVGWTIVVVPATWAVTQVVAKSLALFR